MRKFYLVCILLCTAILTFSQNNESNFIIASDFQITRPISEIFKEKPVNEEELFLQRKLKRQGIEESGDRLHRIPQKFVYNVEEHGPAYGNAEKIMQKIKGVIPTAEMKASWSGQSATGFRPMDPSGAAGPNHYVQMINSTTFRVYNKTTGAVQLTGTLGNLWSPATANAGDPIVMYDKAANRWFLAQFGSGNNNIYIAISTSADPLGSYYTYTFTSPQFPDYLKFSVWSDGYYMTSNQSTQKVFCFERDAMLAGNAAARSVYVNFSPPDGGGFFCPLPGDAADGTLPAVGTPCPIFSYSDNGWGAGFTDAINIYNMSVNWVPTTPTATITSVGAIPTDAFDASYNSSWNDCSQPGTTQKLDGIGGVLMYRAQYKIWGGYNTVVLNWGVRINANERGIMWCEMRQNQTTGVWSVYQQGIYDPDTATRWMGAIAMDNNGSIGLSYIKSDATSIYPGIYYTGRRECDPLGTLPLTEVQVVAGTGYQTGTNRVGDYAHTCLDPDGITFWSTSEYMGGTSGSSAARTHIFSYQIESCTTDASVIIALTSGNNPKCPGETSVFTATPINGGSSPSYQWKVDGNNVGTNSPTYSTTTLTAGQVVSCVMTSNLPGVTNNPATSNSITMSVTTAVTPVVSIAITNGSNPTCPGLPITFTATPTNGGTTPTYQWKLNGSNVGTNSPTYTSTSLSDGQIVSCVMTSSIACVTSSTATSNSITMSVTTSSNASISIAQTSGNNPMCAGSIATFTATVSNASSPSYQWKVNGSNVGTNSPTYSSTTLSNNDVVTCELTTTGSCPLIAKLGTGTGTNATNSAQGAAYPTYYGNGRQQWIIRASELTALGFSAGNITSLGFDVAGTTGDPAVLNGYTIKVAQTTATVSSSTFITSGFTTVFGPVNYTPTLNGLNTHPFSTPFAWDGTSNLCIDICFSNQVVGVTAYQTYRSSTSFVASTFYQADGASGAGACTVASGTTFSFRPNITFTIGAGNVVVPSNGITMNVNPNVTPSVAIALTSGTNPTCSGSSLTFTATPTNGGASPVYQWKVNGSNVGTNSATYTTSSLTNGQIVSCTLTSNAACASPTTSNSNNITVTVTSTVTPSVSIALTTGSNPTCSGSSLTFTATPTNGGASPVYQWKVNGSNVGTNSSTYTTSSLTNGQIVSCTLTSNDACASPTSANSNNITVTVTSTVTPSVSIALTTGSNPTCSGSSLTFTATPTNGGASPVYQWKVNGSNVGTNSATYTTSTLTNGQIVSCTLTSNAACASPTAANSNNISVTVTSTVTPSVSIALTTGSNPTCSGSSLTFTATATNGGASPVYQWKVNGSNVGTNSSIYTTSSLTNGQIVSCTLTSNDACASPTTANSNNITVTVTSTVTPSVSIALTTGSNPTCSGSSLTFTATPTNGGASPVYQWKVNGSNVGTNSATYTTSTLTNGQIVSCTLTSNDACASPTSANSNNITVTVTSIVTPSVSIALTAGSNPTCSGSSLTFTATATNGGASPVYQWKVNGSNVGTNSATYTTSSLTNGQIVSCTLTSNDACASPTSANSNNITVTVTSTVTPSVSIALTTGSNPICSGSSLTFTATPTNGGASPVYQWKVNGSNVGTNSSTYTTSSLTNGQIVSCTLTSNDACASPTSANSNNITVTVTSTVTPSVSIALTTGSNPTCSGSSLTFTATPTNGGASPVYQWKVNGSNVGTNSATYTTSTLTNGQIVSCTLTSNAACASPTAANSNNISVTVTSTVTPSVSIALTTGSNPTCSGSSLTFTATATNGGASPVYQWKVNGSNVGTNSSTYTTSSLTNGQIVSCSLTSNDACASPTTANSNNITVTVTSTVTPSVSIALTTGSNPTCSGSSLTFTATATNGGASPVYQWKVNGSNVGTNSATYTTSSLTNGQIVSCTLTSNDACASPTTANSNNITVTVTSTVAPSVSIALTTGSNPTCSGSSLTFTATATNGGASPVYQWKVNGSNVGTNSATYTTSSLTNGQIVSCTLTSNDACASPTTANSNNITVTVTSTVAPSVSIALTTGSNPTCSGSSLTFTATATNGGASPVYQWKVNGSNVGTNSATYTTSSLTNGQIVSCTLTSNDACASPTTANSNNITVTVSSTSTWYADSDNDGFGDLSNTMTGCTQPMGFVGNSADCDDNNESIYPGAEEICNNDIDDDCDELIDENCCSLILTTSVTNVTCTNGSNGAVDLSITGNAGPFAYSWSNGTTSQDLTNVVSGVYSVTVTAPGNCSSNTSAIVGNDGGSTPAASTFIYGPNGVCRNSTGHVFYVDPIPGATSYLWTLPNGATGTSSTSSITLNFGSSYNTGNLCVRAVNACGQSASFCRSVIAYTSNPSMPGMISGPAANVCPETTYTYSISPVTNATSYSWTAPANATIISGQGTTSCTISFGASFSTSGTVAVRSVNCYGQSSNRNMTVFGRPGLPGSISGTTTNVCPSSTYTYSIPNLASATSYLWTVPSGAIINSGQGTTSISVTFLANFVSGVIGVSGVSECGTGTARTTNVASVPNISGTISGPVTNLCEGGNYTYSVTNIAWASGYNWTLPAGCTMIANNGNSITINVPVGFVLGSLCAQAFGTCGSGSTKCITLYGKPATPGAIAGPSPVCSGQTGLEYTTVGIANLTYTWTVPASVSLVSGQGTNLATMNWGSVNGTVYVKASNACGTSANRTKAVTVTACLAEQAQDSEKLNLPGSQASIRVYPNPNRGEFRIDASSEGNFVILNQVGQVVRTFTLNEDNARSIEVNGLSNGIYYIQGQTKDGEVTEKIVITN